MNPSLMRLWTTSVVLLMALGLSVDAEAKQIGDAAPAVSASKKSVKKKGMGVRVFDKGWKKLKKRPFGKASKKKAWKRRSSKSKAKVRRSWPKARPGAKESKLPALGKVPFESGERLLFKVRMFNGEAGEVLMAVGDTTQVGGRSAVPIVGFIRSSPFLDKIYPVRDRMVVLLDEKTHLPLKTDFYVDEKGRKSDHHTTFNHRSLRIDSVKKRAKKEIRRSFNPDSALHEPLGSLYALRRMKLKVGDRFIAYIWDGRKERQVKVNVSAEEKVWTPAGTFDSLRIDVETRVSGGYINPSEFKAPPKYGRLWLANDRYRTPVKALTPTKIGLAEAILVRRYVEKNNANNPL